MFSEKKFAVLLVITSLIAQGVAQHAFGRTDILNIERISQLINMVNMLPNTQEISYVKPDLNRYNAKVEAEAEAEASEYFSSCHYNDPKFDNCIRNALNDIRPLFKKGLPEYNVAPFDPFYAEELIQIRGFPGFNYKLRLSNITESGWTLSKVTDFRSDFKNYQIQYDQYFPDKRLAGSYEFYGNVVGNKMAVKGVWTLGLFGYTQTTTVTRLPRLENGEEIFDTPLKVEVNLKSCEKLQLHISDLLGGRRLAENVLDRIINFSWPPGLFLLRPLIDDLVSRAFTKIFDDNLRDFPFNEIIPN